MIQDFLLEELHNRPFEFPRPLERAYSAHISDFQARIAGFGGQANHSLNDPSEESVAWQFDCFMPAHYFKALYGLLQMELEASQSPSDYHILSWPSLTVLDVGCGSGAASLAVLTLVHKYQQFLVNHAAPIAPVDIFLLGIDPNPHMLNLYGRMVEQYAPALQPELVRVGCSVYEGEFPQDIRRVLRKYEPNNRHSLLLTLSNIIRPLGDLYETGVTTAFEKIQRLLIEEKQPSGAFGAAEGIAIENILEEWGIDRVSILGITTYESNPNHQWQVALHDLFNGIREEVKPHGFTSMAIRQAMRVEYTNPDNSYWRRLGIARYFNTFYYSFATVINQDFENSKQWQEVLALDNLKLAWARARRNALVDEVLPDELEIRLFDYWLENKLARFRNLLLMRKWEALNVGQFLPFQAPKKQGQTRPKATARLEEQILSAALIQRLGVQFNLRQIRSFSHRLHTHSAEYLYQYWFNLYRLFLAETRKFTAKRKRVLRADVMGFYQNVDQKMLFDIVVRELEAEQRAKEALQYLILRDLAADHREGEGLLQGHIASGFWANMYLSKLDKGFQDLDGVEFARYADDMVFAVEPKRMSTDVVEKQLRTLLEVLHLNPSEDKTFPQSSEEYQEEITLDTEIDRLAKDVQRLRAKLFKLNREYEDRYRNDGWAFLTTYRKLLGSIEIYISSGWIGRKIEQELNNSWIWLGFPPFRLKFPPYPNSEDEMSKWGQLFRDLNVAWVLQINLLRERLTHMCLVALHVLRESNGKERVMELQRRRFKFAINRLCSLGLGSVANEIVDEVINHPWLMDVDLVCRGLSLCGRYDLLLQIFDRSDLPFTRAHALRGLAPYAHDPEVLRRLWSVLESCDTEPCEKLKASESLLVADNWQGANLDTCIALAEAEGNPYLKKNYVLILGQAFKHEARLYLEGLQAQSIHPVVVDAVQYLFSSNFAQLRLDAEPDALLKYYDQYYPDAESDAKSEESDPGWLPI